MGRFTLALCRRRWLAFPQASQPDQRLPDFSGHYRVIQDLGPGTLGQFLGRPVDPENKPVAEPSRLQEHLLARLISRRAFFSIAPRVYLHADAAQTRNPVPSRPLKGLGYLLLVDGSRLTMPS